uniref:Uncharacterized protein n=1 Tax=Corethron hystrix TaxID=216773 RepID=A0A7S1FWH3_9STRA|mmetsp:Transcript_36206/g.84672  ORF Transcript_36206/g.84672 Transcript_36206/m.84672 type:complete len:271 (+) Transcript_36206:164-976(+)
MKPILTCTVITNKATFQNKSQTARAYSRKNRIYTFRRFLLDTFPRLSRTVNCNDGRDDPPPIVLDVAGGKGSLSFLLQHVDGYESVVVDPVPNNYRSIVRSIEFLARNPAVRRERAVEGWEGHQPLAALLPRLMKRAQIDTTETAAAWTEEENLSFFPPASHLKLYFDNALVEAVREYVTQSKIDEQTAFHDWSVFFHSASARISFNGTRNNHNIISDPHRALHTIMVADLLVGFHPDQATVCSKASKHVCHFMFNISIKSSLCMTRNRL